MVTPPTLPDQVVGRDRGDHRRAPASLNNQIPVTIAGGQALSGSHDFGYTLADTSRIGDTVYLDFDGDGSQDPTEAGIPNITVRLYQDVDRDGTVDAGVDDLLATDVTDSSGSYLFEGLAAGSYVVEVDTADPDFPTQTTATGDPDVTTGRIGDLVYLDANGNGTWDAGENGISGVVVLLYANTDKDGAVDPGELQVAAQRTDANGAYLFTGLAAGDYLVEVDTATLPAGLSLTSGAFANVTLATSASVDLTQDAGYSPSTNYALGNRVWHDVDGDNVQDPGEVGIGGATVTVTRTTAGPCNPGCTATTDAAGFWIVTGLTTGRLHGGSVGPAPGLRGHGGHPHPDHHLDRQHGRRRRLPLHHPRLHAHRHHQRAGSSRTHDGDLVYDSGEEVGGATVNLLDEDGNSRGHHHHRRRRHLLPHRRLHRGVRGPGALHASAPATASSSSPPGTASPT